MKIIEIISYNYIFHKMNVIFYIFAHHYITYGQIRKIKYLYYIYLA